MVSVLVCPLVIPDKSNLRLFVVSLLFSRVKLESFSVTLLVLSSVLFWKVSVPVSVANVPDAGSVRFEPPPAPLSVIAFEVVNASPNPTFFPAARLSVSVPPNVILFVSNVVVSFAVRVFPLATLNVPPPLLVTVKPLYVPAKILPPSVKLPLLVKKLLLLKKLILPVVPSVKLCPLVVPSVPLPVR